MQWHPLPGRQWQLHSKTPMQPMRRESRLQEASQALGNSSAALSQDQQTMAEAARQARDMTGAGLAGENSTDLSSVVKGLQALSEGLGQLSAQTETAGEQYLAGVDSGMEQLKSESAHRLETVCLS